MVRDHSLQSIRVANVGYLNGAPYRAIGDVETVEYLEASPAECSRMLIEREVELALVPIVDVLAHGGFTILPFGIAARNAVQSVVLLSQAPLDSLKTIYIDRSSHTSVLLLRALLTSSHPQLANKLRFFRAEPLARSHELQRDEGLLVIGDRAFALTPKFRFVFDLAQLWREQTGLPFVFAAWAYRPEIGNDPRFEKILKALTIGIDQRAIYARDWADAQGMPREEAEAYVNDKISYRLEEEFIAGLCEFQRRGAQLNLLPETCVETSFSFGKSEEARKQRVTNSSFQTYFCCARNVDSILDDASSGKRISLIEGLRIAKDASLGDLSLAADLRRSAIHELPRVSYIVDRNINYTNVCNVYCSFCAFYRAPEIGGKKSKKSEGGYLLTKEEIGQKIEEMITAGGIQILLQGGLNPDLGIEYYEDLFRWIKENYPIKLHALSSDEILHIARVSSITLDEVIDRLIASGLDSLPGAGAEILVDSVRRRIARLKSPAEEWLDVHRVAHRKGLSSTCTMMFGVQETWESRIIHLAKLRHLQDETRGFTAFISWPFQDENTKAKKGNTSAGEYLRVQSLCRLFLDNIPNIQSSWVTMGPSVGQTALYFGANDFGSVMFEENVVSAAGTTYCMNSSTVERNIIEAGFSPWQRTMDYQPISLVTGAMFKAAPGLRC